MHRIRVSQRLLLGFLATISLLAAGCGSEATPSKDFVPVSADEESAGKQKDPALTEAESVQEDVRKMVNAMYQSEPDVILSYTHPKIIDMLGGREKAKSMLESACADVKSMGMKVESMTFPVDPTFLDSYTNRYVIVPTLTIVSANGQRLESKNYQFGIQEIGTKGWKFVEGSRINQQNVRTLFPDFPKSYEFPEFYRKRL